MQLSDALRLSKKPRLAFVGAGGKTTALSILAKEMPKPLLDAIREFHSQYELRYSYTAMDSTYVNVCECRANFGNFFLYEEPGGPFFPMSSEQASLLTIRTLQIKGTFEFENIGTNDDVFNWM